MEIITAIMNAFDEAQLLTDDAYAEALQFQEALQDSLNMSEFGNPSNSYETSASPRNKSNAVVVSCEICTDEKQESDMFELEGCRHSFCAVCVSKHVEYKLRDNVIVISCPDQNCPNTIQPRALRSHVAAEVLDRWEEAVAESAILASQRVRCPYEGCSEIMVDDGDGRDGGGSAAECPWCHRLFCVKCKVPWHQGLDCREFQKFDRGKREKEKLRVLARENKWKKCPSCKLFVEKTGGCIHITCRCKFEFCYVCGANWSEAHWKTCQE
ncbi:hypothetical protein C2S52_005286 [Perilla frutescens var. hirtella]|nr:hypothetical protein C2S52_005286 [Perilla frutescens var. hirtella]